MQASGSYRKLAWSYQLIQLCYPTGISPRPIFLAEWRYSMVSYQLLSSLIIGYFFLFISTNNTRSLFVKVWFNSFACDLKQNLTSARKRLNYCEMQAIADVRTTEYWEFEMIHHGLIQRIQLFDCFKESFLAMYNAKFWQILAWLPREGRAFNSGSYTMP